MKTKIIFLLLLLVIVGCKKAQEAIPSFEQQLQGIKDATQQTINETVAQLPQLPQQEPSQIIFVPQEKGTISYNYISSCALQKYKGLNLYCKFKNFWHNQSTLLSWYVPYSVVLLLALALIIVLIIWLWRRR